ncbi:peptidoglycan DD-metalloendopeptidase family protein, partial [Klebsiella pneumoniae]|uniref:peptidoglycan DD-metalloendopeptidase family protein n=1 Tax=Klebsiella pneumoniae TaxID=573 RepID=UPI00272FEB1F
EDWYGGPDYVTGSPVRAAARGRVTYSYPLGWGRDGGVVILQHTFPDGTTAYSQYGHIIESDTVKCPRRQDCVSAGDIIGVIADARPAPH